MSKKKKPKKTQGNSLNHRILEVFRKDPTQSFNYKQVSKRLDVKQTSKRKLIGKILYELFDKGHLIEEKPGRFKLEPSAANLQTMVGKVDMTQSGIAYIEVEGLPDDIYISEQNIGTALHGDLVEVSLAKVKRNGKPIGKIEKVVERAMTDFVGTIEKSLKYAF